MLLLALLISGCAPKAEEEPQAKAPEERAVQPKPKPKPASATLPEGTVLKVRTTNTISTKTHQAGEKFQATLEEPLEEGGRVVAAKGALVEGRIVASDPGGRVKGRAELAVGLTALHVAEGHVVELETNVLGREAKSTQKDDARKIGIGSAAGAAIGAIAGGGKGAAIGAASGAGAGTGLVLATRGAAAVLPAESVLSFRLRAPVTISR
jgi:hypothetical protein